MYVTLHVGLPIESGRGPVTTCFFMGMLPPKASNYAKESGFNKGLLTTIVLLETL